MTLSQFDKDKFRVVFTTPGTQAAGAIFTFPAFTQHTHELLSMSFTFDTDVNVADRMILLKIAHGPSWNYFASSGAVQTASTSCLYVFGRGLGLTDTADAPQFSVPIPEDILFVKADLLTIQILTIQAGDQLKSIAAQFKLYPTG